MFVKHLFQNFSILIHYITFALVYNFSKIFKHATHNIQHYYLLLGALTNYLNE